MTSKEAVTWVVMWVVCITIALLATPWLIRLVISAVPYFDRYIEWVLK